MIPQDLLHAVRVAFLLSREQGRPAFIYRPAVPIPAPVITFDEDIAARLCDADGYTRCDATREAADDASGS